VSLDGGWWLWCGDATGVAWLPLSASGRKNMGDNEYMSVPYSIQVLGQLRAKRTHLDTPAGVPGPAAAAGDGSLGVAWPGCGCNFAYFARCWRSPRERWGEWAAAAAGLPLRA